MGATAAAVAEVPAAAAVVDGGEGDTAAIAGDTITGEERDDGERVLDDGRERRDHHQALTAILAARSTRSARRRNLRKSQMRRRQKRKSKQQIKIWSKQNMS
mmetsp:Transcript_27355/g.59644  ORF Transcript_27355/g.59644 Transcript_27355/m.59644 type:complete len:102 (+) Transcript_27355:331-636(+)